MNSYFTICGLMCLIISVDGLSPLIVHEVSKGDTGSTFDELRDSKKIVFFNNRAYDLSNKNHRVVWNMYMKKAYDPEAINLDLEGRQINTDPLLKTRLSDFSFVNQKTTNNPSILSSTTTTPKNKNKSELLVKSSRFVADPEKYHLIETIEDDTSSDKEDSKPSSSSSSNDVIIDNRIDNSASSTSPPPPPPSETSTVYYKQEETSMFQFIFNELIYNFGSLLTRELFSDIGSVFSFIWNSIFYSVSDAGRAFINAYGLTSK